MEKSRLTIRWCTRDEEKISKIRERFGIPTYTTVNGLSPVEIAADDMEMLKECERRGLIGILPFKWSKNGSLYSFNSR